MLWGLISSAFVIYLYRFLKAATAPEVAANEDSPASVEAALADLNKHIDALELRAGVAKEAPS